MAVSVFASKKEGQFEENDFLVECQRPDFGTLTQQILEWKFISLQPYVLAPVKPNDDLVNDLLTILDV